MDGIVKEVAKANRRRVVITGMGTLNPLAHNVSETWDAALHGRSGIGPITLFDAAELKTRIAAEVKGFDPVAHFGRKDARRMARITQLTLAAADQALDEAGLKNGSADRNRIGVLIGSAMGNLDPVFDNLETMQTRGADRVSPFLVPMMLADTPSAMVSITYGLRGPNMSVATACATGNNALGEAAEMIRRGAADVMLAGGADAAIFPLVIAGFGVMGALSTRNDQPEQASRPFDAQRDGFITGEGAAVLVLEAYDHALERGATVHGELLGYGTSADAYHVSSPAEGGEGAVRAMQIALNDAGITAEAIDYINAHGTSTPLNDRSETAALKRLLGERAYDVPISSTKSVHGHLLGAAGALEALITVKTLAEGYIPPTVNYEHPDPDCDLDYVPNVARAADLRIAMSNGFGFGGHNATIILSKLPL
jgi:3-oxoacyl-[acyl-carrier-protein] synthase II